MDEVIQEWRSVDEKEGEAPTLNSNLQYLVEQIVANQHLLNADILSMAWAGQDAVCSFMMKT